MVSTSGTFLKIFLASGLIADEMLNMDDISSSIGDPKSALTIETRGASCPDHAYCLTASSFAKAGVPVASSYKIHPADQISTL